MNKAAIDEFAGKIIDINAAPLIGNISAGGLGALGARQAALLDLKKKTLDLASELRSGNPNKARLSQFFNRVEGSLRGLRTLAVIDERRLASLLHELNSLRTSALRD